MPILISIISFFGSVHLLLADTDRHKLLDKTWKNHNVHVLDKVVKRVQDTEAVPAELNGFVIGKREGLFFKSPSGKEYRITPASGDKIMKKLALIAESEIVHVEVTGILRGNGIFVKSIDSSGLDFAGYILGIRSGGKREKVLLWIKNNKDLLSVEESGDFWVLKTDLSEKALIKSLKEAGLSSQTFVEKNAIVVPN